MKSVQEVRSISTVYDFQKQMMWYVNEQIVKRSMSSYTVSGIENLDPSGHYLFVSNHRDIMLDASRTPECSACARIPDLRDHIRRQPDEFQPCD